MGEALENIVPLGGPRLPLAALVRPAVVGARFVEDSAVQYASGDHIKFDVLAISVSKSTLQLRETQLQ